MNHPPKSLQGILWSTDVGLLDIDKDKGYIIPQVLIYGSMDELRWLLHTYGRNTITTDFLQHPKKLFPRSTFLFVKNYLLPLQHVALDEQDYVTSISGPIRQRTASRLS